MDKRARQKEYNTLACVPIGLIGYRTTIELFNDAYVTGKIVDADAMMNIDLLDAKYVDGNGTHTFLKNFHVRGRKVRFVHIPDELDVMKIINSVVAPRPVVPRKVSLKEKIMRKRDLQTLKRYQRSQQGESSGSSYPNTASTSSTKDTTNPTS